MKIENFFKYLSGYLTICADGPFTERLINICMHREMPIWDIKRCGSHRITFKTTISAFKQIRTPAKRTRSHVRITKRHGLPFTIHRYRHRKFAIAGGLVVILALYYLSGHIIGITVFGNQRISTEEIIDNLKMCGLKIGSKTEDVEPDIIRNRMMSEMDELAWIGINASGARVYVEVVERLEKEEGVEKEGRACNLVAARDGEIESIEVREGQTIVKTGSGVRSGDVLVSGVVDNSVSGFRYVMARGEVYAKTRYKKTRSYPLVYTERVPTGAIKKRFTISFMDFKIPFFINKAEPYPEFSYKQNKAVWRFPFNLLPPINIEKEEYAEEVSEVKERTRDDALREGSLQLLNELKAELDEDVEIKEENIDYTLTEHGEVEITAELICRENIAVPSVIEIPI